jgi:hypothetical protein
MLPFIDPEFARQLGIPFVSNEELAARAASLQYLSNLDEDLTVWDTTLEFDTDANQVVQGHNLFKWIAFTERLDALILTDERSSIACAVSKPSAR